MSSALSWIKSAILRSAQGLGVEIKKSGPLQYKFVRATSFPKDIRKDDQQILNRARTNYASNDKGWRQRFPDLGKRWGSFADHLATRIPSFSSIMEVIDFAQTSGYFDHRRVCDQETKYEINVARHFLEYEYPHFANMLDGFSDSPYSHPSTLVVKKDDNRTRYLSNIMFFHAVAPLSLLGVAPTISSICEIGGGYGSPALIWMTNPINEIKRYCIIDIPEVLFFAEVFLAASMPQSEIVYIDGNASKLNQDTSRSILLCPIAHSARTEEYEFDAAVNTLSMAEMTDGWVHHWGSWLDRQSVKWFYSHNYFGNPIDSIYEGRNRLAPLVSAQWVPVKIRTMHPMFMLQSRERRALEIVFNRRPSAILSTSDIGQCLLTMKDFKLTMDNYAWFVYALLSRPTDAAVLLAQRAFTDFGYWPVELTKVLEVAIAQAELEPAGRLQAVGLHEELMRTYSAKYPQGAWGVDKHTPTSKADSLQA